MTDEKFWNKLDKMHEEIIQLRIEVAKLKIKSGLWGALSGVVMTTGILLLSAVK